MATLLDPPASSTRLPKSQVVAPPSLRWPLLLFAASRLLFIAVSIAALAWLTPGHTGNRLIGLDGSTWLTGWYHWDALWYTNIARNGYQTTAQSAFFPLFPASIWLIHLPLRFMGTDLATVVAGLLVSNSAFAGFLCLFYRWSVPRYGERFTRDALLVITLAPLAVFTVAPYSESLFLLFLMGLMVALDADRPWLASICLSLAILDRQTGVALFVPVLLYGWQRYGREWQGWRRFVPVLILPLLALAAYCLFLGFTLHQPLAFIAAEQHWKRRLIPFPIALPVALLEVLRLPFGSVAQINLIVQLLLISTALTLLLLPLLPQTRQRFDQEAPWLGLGWALLVLPLSTPLWGYRPDILSSQGRYLLVDLPAILILARVMQSFPGWRDIILTGSLVLCTLTTVIFVLGGYIV